MSGELRRAGALGGRVVGAGSGQPDLVLGPPTATAHTPTPSWPGAAFTCSCGAAGYANTEAALAELWRAHLAYSLPDIDRISRRSAAAPSSRGDADHGSGAGSEPGPRPDTPDQLTDEAKHREPS